MDWITKDYLQPKDNEFCFYDNTTTRFDWTTYECHDVLRKSFPFLDDKGKYYLHEYG